MTVRQGFNVLIINKYVYLFLKTFNLNISVPLYLQVYPSTILHIRMLKIPRGVFIV